eukprot:366301-Chlamydomonas_euryale.AAC.57
MQHRPQQHNQQRRYFHAFLLGMPKHAACVLHAALGFDVAACGCLCKHGTRSACSVGAAATCFRFATGDQPGELEGCLPPGCGAAHASAGIGAFSRGAPATHAGWRCVLVIGLPRVGSKPASPASASSAVTSITSKAGGTLPAKAAAPPGRLHTPGPG